MNAIEIEQAVSNLAEQPFESAAFPYAFLEAFGNKATTIKRLNPAVEAQATDRAYRIGQKNNVMVHRFITKNTFEERINEMIQAKKALADMTVATGENWIGNLSNHELRELFVMK